MTRLLLLLSLSVIACLGADLSGTWSGSFVIQFPNAVTQENTCRLILKEEDGVVTGTTGLDSDRQMDISNGRLKEDQVSFEVIEPRGEVVIRFDLEWKGDRLRGKARAEQRGHGFDAKVDLKRQKVR